MSKYVSRRREEAGRTSNVASGARQMVEILENADVHHQGESHRDVRFRAHIARMAFGPGPCIYTIYRLRFLRRSPSGGQRLGSTSAP